MGEFDLFLRTLTQTAVGLVFCVVITCRFLRMRGQASLIALAKHLGLAMFAAYCAVEPLTHAPDNWFVIAGAASIAALMNSTRGRWLDELPEEFRRRVA